MRIQSEKGFSTVGMLMVSAASVLLVASAGASPLIHAPVALADDKTSTGIVQDICVDAGLEVKLFIHAAGRAPAFGAESGRSCESDDKDRKARSAAAVTTGLMPHDAAPHNPLQEQS